MSQTPNFKQAVKELFGIDKTIETGSEFEESGFDENQMDIPEEAISPVSQNTTDNSKLKGYKTELPVSDYNPELRAPSPVRPMETSIISAGTTISGQIRSQGHLEILGSVDGSAEAAGNIKLHGKFLGNVSGNNIFVNACLVQGNLTAARQITVDGNSAILGDIVAEEVTFNGNIKGNITATRSVSFETRSYITGDVTSQVISMKQGSVINGNIKTLRENNKGDEIFGSFSALEAPSPQE